ncbi:MAG: hypothetical protein NWR30_12650, partial [Salibacteraceae bacterium]|nr:hypothetical protein [Salibacteraceae bacterium]
FEKYIREQRMQFDDAEPSARHAQVFEKKLAGKEHSNPLRMIWWAAAVIVLFVGVAAVMKNLPDAPQETENTSMALKEVSSEMADVEAFYTEEILQSKTMLSAFGADQNQIELLNKNLDLLEQQYDYLKSELAAHPGDQRIITSMIENYRTRLQLLEKHLLFIQKYQQHQNQTSHENA